MKKVMTVFLGMALSIPAMAFAQNAQSSQQQQDDKNTQQQENQAAMTDQTGGNTMPRHTMSGVVSNNGRTFTSDNKIYTVKNPNALKNYNDQSVSVVFLFNTDNNTIRILSVSPGQQQ